MIDLEDIIERLLENPALIPSTVRSAKTTHLFNMIENASIRFRVPVHKEQVQSDYRIPITLEIVDATVESVANCLVKIKRLNCELCNANGLEIIAPNEETASLLRLSL